MSWAPGLAALRSYDRRDLPADLLAGLSIAAIAVPVAVAYAQLAGFNPVVGFYSSILPMVAYAVFGSSRQLVVGPDSGVCALVAAAVAPLAAGNADLYLSLSVMLALLAGLILLAGSFFRLGGLADFLSKPILVGFMNGVALSILLDQLGKIFGFPIAAGGIVPRLFEFASKLGRTHLPTLAVGAGTFLVLRASRRFFPRAPATLIAVAGACAAVKLLGLDAAGVKTVGDIPGALPRLRLPSFPAAMLPRLLAEASGVALVSFSSHMPPARGFAAKNGYEVDGDREMAALGLANIASAASQGFAVCAAGSRTAAGDAAGGRSQVAGLTAAAAILAVLLFFTGPLRLIPDAALAAVLAHAALSMTDFETLMTISRVDRTEFWLSVAATLGVVAVGTIQAVLVAVALAVTIFVKLASRPETEILGIVEGFEGFHALSRHPDARTVPGMALFRFNAPLVFFNAPYFKKKALAAADAAGPELRWFVLDMIPVSLIDSTGLYAAREVVAALRARGVYFVTAGRLTEWQQRSLTPEMRLDRRNTLFFPSLAAAVEAFRREPSGKRPE